MVCMQSWQQHLYIIYYNHDQITYIINLHMILELLCSNIFKPYLKHLNMKNQKLWKFQFSVYSCSGTCMNTTMLLSQPLFNEWGVNCTFPLWTQLHRRFVLHHKINRQIHKWYNNYSSPPISHWFISPLSNFIYKSIDTLFFLIHTVVSSASPSSYKTLWKTSSRSSSSIITRKSYMWPRNKPWFCRQLSLNSFAMSAPNSIDVLWSSSREIVGTTHYWTGEVTAVRSSETDDRMFQITYTVSHKVSDFLCT